MLLIRRNRVALGWAKRFMVVVICICCATHCSKESTESQSITSIISIASLRDYESNYRSILISASTILEGRVTANDMYDEFNSCLIIEDQSAAARLLCDADNLYRDYPIGAAVQISCSGLYLSNQYGSLTLGAEPTGDYTLDYIATSRIGQYLKLIDSEASEPDATLVTLADLTPLHSYLYVELRNVTITPAEGVANFCERDPDSGRTIDTTHTLTDSSGGLAELFVDSQCSYGDMPLPSGACTIHAIVDYYSGSYRLTIVNASYIEN